MAILMAKRPLSVSASLFLGFTTRPQDTDQVMVGAEIGCGSDNETQTFQGPGSLLEDVTSVSGAARRSRTVFRSQVSHAKATMSRTTKRSKQTIFPPLTSRDKRTMKSRRRDDAGRPGRQSKCWTQEQREGSPKTVAKFDAGSQELQSKYWTDGQGESAQGNREREPKAVAKFEIGNQGIQSKCWTQEYRDGVMGKMNKKIMTGGHAELAHEDRDGAPISFPSAPFAC